MDKARPAGFFFASCSPPPVPPPLSFRFCSRIYFFIHKFVSFVLETDASFFFLVFIFGELVFSPFFPQRCPRVAPPYKRFIGPILLPPNVDYLRLQGQFLSTRSDRFVFYRLPDRLSLVLTRRKNLSEPFDALYLCLFLWWSSLISTVLKEGFADEAANFEIHLQPPKTPQLPPYLSLASSCRSAVGGPPNLFFLFTAIQSYPPPYGGERVCGAGTHLAILFTPFLHRGLLCGPGLHYAISDGKHRPPCVTPLLPALFPIFPLFSQGILPGGAAVPASSRSFCIRLVPRPNLSPSCTLFYKIQVRYAQLSEGFFYAAPFFRFVCLVV